MILNNVLMSCIRSVNKYKIYYKIFKHTSNLQWKSCTSLFSSSAFIAHTQSCPTSTDKKVPFKFSIVQTLIKEETSKKPFTEYVIQVRMGERKWTISRRYKQFCALHASLERNFPDLEFPQSAQIFWNKSILDIRKNAVVDGRRKMLQKYVCDIGEIPIIRDSKKFKLFVGINEGGLEIEDVVLPQTSIEEIFNQFTSKTTTQQKLNAYETFSTRYL
jgi:hypothetical protein